MSAFSAIFHELDTAGAGYVVVGGLAVVLHGYARVTADVDLVVDLRPGEAIKAIAALTRLGMVPRAPVAARDFADASIRRTWVEEKAMRVFSMHDPRKPLVEVDLFVDPPISYEQLRARATLVRLNGSEVPVACIDDLVRMKRLAGRPRDLDDIRALEEIARKKS